MRLFTIQHTASTPILVIVLGPILLIGELAALFFTGFSPFNRAIVANK